MTGKDVKALADKLDGLLGQIGEGDWTPQDVAASQLLDALAPCVVLTAEERERVAGCMELLSRGILTKNITDEWSACLALLSPNEAGDDGS